MIRNDQQSTCTNAACGNRDINNQSVEGHQGRNTISRVIQKLYWESEKIRFLKYIEVFEEI